LVPPRCSRRPRRYSQIPLQRLPRIPTRPPQPNPDWGVTYGELEPHFDRFEYLLGTSGKAGNIKGQILPGGDPYESRRSREYPTPPMKEHFQGAMFGKAAASLGYHPFPQPSSNLSQPYTNPEGMKLNACYYASLGAASQ
jgi:gluconate 2-dehydrogenase alpha chain